MEVGMGGWFCASLVWSVDWVAETEDVDFGGGCAHVGVRCAWEVDMTLSRAFCFPSRVLLFLCLGVSGGGILDAIVAKVLRGIVSK
jgi:hypothetical protein